MGGGFHIGRVAGIDVRVDWSLFIIFFLITLSLAGGVFPSWHPQWSPGLAWLTALGASLLFFASVFLHELSHALVGRAQGIEIKRITLFIFGGMAEMQHEPHTWRAELWMSLVGPLVSLVLGVMFLLLAALIVGPLEVDAADPQQFFSQLGPLATLLMWLGPINIFLAVFNLVPGFPLDGGRVLRALLWGITGDLRRATQWASRLGQVFAWVLIMMGFGMMFGLRMPIFGTGLVSGMWLAFIGWFLHNAALVSYRQLLVRESLENVPVSRLMQTRFVTVEPNMRLDTLVEEHLMPSGQRAFPVLDGERWVGIVCLQDIRKVKQEAWPSTAVGDIMTGAQDVAQVLPEADAADAMATLSQRGVNQLPVVDQGTVRGLIRREDILAWLALRSGENLASMLPPLNESGGRPPRQG
ncbi:MAG: site-2 protease family protein [Gammaproteobacteria bacterium]